MIPLPRGRHVYGIVGVLLVFLFVLLHSPNGNSSSSTRQLVSQGWEKAKSSISGQDSRDGFRDFHKGPSCSFSSLDLHHPFQPKCKGRADLLEAMSGGGRLGYDAPYWNRGCDMRWYTSSEMCNIFSRFDRITFVGDAALRHAAQALNVLLRNDLVDGGRAIWNADRAAPDCDCNRVFEEPRCASVAAVNAQEVLEHAPATIPCATKPALVSWVPAWSYPLDTSTTDEITASLDQNVTDGRDVFIVGHGIWKELSLDATMSWLEQVEDAVAAKLPGLFDQSTASEAFPRLFLTPNAQGEDKSDPYRGSHNNVQIASLSKEIAHYVEGRGYDHLSLYNLTIQSSSPDGVNMSYGNNLVKGMMIMNWLGSLEQPKARQRPTRPTAPPPMDPLTEIVNRPPSDNITRPSSSLRPTTSTSPVQHTGHPIDDLLNTADQQLNELLQQTTSGVKQAADAYRDRRGRHPPPGFDKWVRFAEARGAVMIEEFFDQLHHDLEPFWAVPPAEMRAFPRSWDFVISIRNSTMQRYNDEPRLITPWMDLYEGGMQDLLPEDLPDVDLAFNSDDEPRIFVPHDLMSQHLRTAESQRPPLTRRPIHTTNSRLPPFPTEIPKEEDAFSWPDVPKGTPLWPIARDTCPPSTPAHSAALTRDYTEPPFFPNNSLPHMHSGYVANWSSAKSTCANPHLRSLHGTFIAMQADSIQNHTPDQDAFIFHPVPLLAGCKIHDINGEILIPPAMQWPNRRQPASDFGFEFQESYRVPWSEKKDELMWRGSASGGINNKDNWTRFQRHRLLAMLNGTLVSEHVRRAGQPPPEHVPGGDPVLPHNFPVPNREVYRLAALEDDDAPSALGRWVSSISDAAFIHLRCYPPVTWFSGNGQECPYSGPFYNIKPSMPLPEMVKYKYQPDVDGASYSGRYRSLLMSNSLPMKATIYDEWHDSRLVAWKHFVPMDNTFVDVWGLLEYFLGYGDKRAGHDDAAARIAGNGSGWARRVLRYEDMLVWMYRLILELARLSDDRRLEMGFIGDS